MNRRLPKSPVMAILILAVVALSSWFENGSVFQTSEKPRPTFEQPENQTTEGSIDEAFKEHRSDVQVTAEGIVSKILPDDRDGSRHQRFIVKLSSGNTVLIAHNIDLAPRVPNLDTGQEIRFRGEYEWNEKGGVVHWTHHDPNGRHEGGWLEVEGERYE